MTHRQLELHRLSFPLILLIPFLTFSVQAQTATDTSKSTTTSETTESSTPTDCDWDASLGDYLSCNKEKFTTTQLVGAGIGVTLLIFIFAFTTLWLCRRTKKPRSRKAKRDAERAKVADEEDIDEKPDKADDDKYIKHTLSVPSGRYDKRGSDQSQDGRRPSSRVVRVEDEDPANKLQAPKFLTVPSPSARSSRIGSPTEPQSTRQLYPSNPDPRNSLKPPTRPARPPSSQWLAGASHEAQPAMPTMPPPRYSSRPPTSSNLRPPDERSMSRSPSPSASSQRPVSSAATTRPGTQPEVQPTIQKRPSSALPAIQSIPQVSPASTDPAPQSTPPRPPAATRSASMRSTDTSQTDYNDMPLPVPPTGAVAEGTRPLPARSSSRGSVIPNSRISKVPSIPGQPVPSPRPVSVYPLGQAPSLNPNPNPNPTPSPAPTPDPNPMPTPNVLSGGMRAVRQSVSTTSNHGVRASSVSVSVHEGDPSAARSEGIMSRGPVAFRPVTVEEEGPPVPSDTT